MCKTERENPIVTRSRAALIGAATVLLDERDASAISVKDVVETAAMSRPTFYQHFADLGALFAAAGLVRLEQSMAGIEPAVQAPRGLHEAFAPVLMVIVDRMQPHAEFYSRVNGSSGGQLFHAGVVASTAMRLRREPLLQSWAHRDDIFWEFFAAGVVWALTRHLNAVSAGESSHVAADLAGIFDFVFTR
ncbi:helix-turn-helix domain-containing protein [Kineosporia sp. NBRC 101731]|uniref:TetR/AcrR family transcriptional regulator n=1 Tax=Kineosporia sp. NBRC 101731 TaxID=3032199 RepID=UPI0024A5C698|nr:helix-turn-helix domain-containing protein [Kineosporia sp. NBRC 101731]GLY29066.1 hypothetical protein Kisp02_24310 [Kineosporia sp. NBRC 101731]